jgi:hypothetical protein
MLVLVSVLFSASVHALGFPIEIIEYFDQTRVVVFLNEEDIDKTLDWSPFEGQPPLTIADTLEGVREYITGNVELADAEVMEIELKRIPHHESHWHYLVKMKTRADDTPQFHFLIVLMNGKIVQGLKEPEGYK